jgi:EAL domain-containing protein (putative c-di-GMP-specific phosphodiesterase class I)
MAHSLKLRVVAEGVETADQLRFLRSERCETVQGFFLHRPLPAAEVAGVLKHNRMRRDGRVPVYA